MDAGDEDKRAFICTIFTGKSLSALKPCEQRRVVLLEVTVQQEDQMRVLAVLFGVGTAVGIAASVSAAPNESSIQLAQAQDAGTQSGAGASQRGSTGNRQGGATVTGGSQERGAATRQSGDGSATVRSETTRTSRTTTVRERAGSTRVSVHGGTRRVVGVRATTGDDAVVIRRKRARGYVYSGPSTTVIRKKRYVHYREPSSAVIINKRRPTVAVEGVSTRTSVRSRTSTTVRNSGTTGASIGAARLGG